jgi:hypothetical protein
MASVPANSDTLAGLPSSDTRTDNIHDPDDFMSGRMPSFVTESL